MTIEVKMSAVIRIKRSLNENPADAVLLNCKKRKIDADQPEDADEMVAVLKFAATVKDPKDYILKYVKPKPEYQEQYKKHTSDIIERLRQQNRIASKTNRLKVINTFCSSDLSLGEDGESSKGCTVVDIEPNVEEIEQEDFIEDSVSNSKFVYDLYYTNSDDFGEADLNELVSVYPLSDHVIYGPHRDNINNVELESDDSEDSNAENNWRNDYPDESEVESVDEEDNLSISENDMFRAMRRVEIDDDDNSDDYEDYGYRGSPYGRFKTQCKNDFYDNYDESCTP